MIDQHDCLVEVFGQSAPLQQSLSRFGLDRGKLKGMVFLVPQYEDNGAVTQVANAVKQYYSPMPNVLVIHPTFMIANSEIASLLAGSR